MTLGKRAFSMGKNNSIEKNEQFYQKLFQRSPIAQIICDFDGLILDANEGFLSLSGASSEDIKSKNIAAFIPPEYADLILLRESLSQNDAKESAPLEIEIQNPAGQRTPATIQCLKIDYGARCLLYTFENLTQLKQSEEQTSDAIRRLATIVEYSYDAIMSIDLNKVIVSWNKGAERLFGYTAEEAIGQPISMLAPPELEGAQDQHIHNVDQMTGSYHFQTIRMRKDGTRLVNSITLSSIYDSQGTIVGHSGIIRDITQQRQLEQETQRLNEELEQRVADRTTQLERANRELAEEVLVRGAAEKKLSERNDELNSFAYTVSHDLKAPLRAMSGYASELQRRYLDNAPERARFCAGQIVNAVDNLHNLIEDLLLYARIEADHPETGSIDLERTIADILNARSAQIAECGAQITTQLDVTEIVEWKQGLIRILDNLIDNALKYSKNSHPPQIAIGSSQTGEKYRIWVRDNGIGFDMKYHDRIFGLFNRLVRQDEYEGTGAGLAIVKKIADIRGGRVWAESSLGSGSTFHLELKKTLPYP